MIWPNFLRRRYNKFGTINLSHLILPYQMSKCRNYNNMHVWIFLNLSECNFNLKYFPHKKNKSCTTKIKTEHEWIVKYVLAVEKEKKRPNCHNNYNSIQSVSQNERGKMQNTAKREENINIMKNAANSSRQRKTDERKTLPVKSVKWFSDCRFLTSPFL